MSKNTLYDKIWDLHKVTTLPTGQDQLFIDLNFTHEVTSPQAYEALREKGIKALFPERTFATVDHVIPTDDATRPFEDAQSELMTATLEKNAKDFGITYFGPNSGRHGIVHIIGPELGLTQPGQTITCGDSHTSTHGAFGALAFGIGTTEIQHVLETQSLALNRLKVKKINVTGTLQKGVTAKDVILKIIQELGVKGGIGYAYEFTGPVIEKMSMEARMTICNMSIEGGARIGYINPDQTTYNYLKNREYAPKKEEFDKKITEWQSIRSDKDAVYDDEYEIDVTTLEPMVTWGITPAQAIEVTNTMPEVKNMTPEDLKKADEAYAYTKFSPGKKVTDITPDVIFIGSCTNGRIEDFREAAQILKGQKVKIQTLVVPGSEMVKKQVEDEGLDKIFIAAGAEWRLAGCSMCLAMNPDKLIGDQISVSTSNRNFMGRQGSTNGRTILSSPYTAAATAIAGHIVDCRDFL